MNIACSRFRMFQRGKKGLLIHENKSNIVKTGAREPAKRNIFVSMSTKYLQAPIWPSFGAKGKMNQHANAEDSMMTKIKSR